LQVRKKSFKLIL